MRQSATLTERLAARRRTYRLLGLALILFTLALATVIGLVTPQPVAATTSAGHSPRLKAGPSEWEAGWTPSAAGVPAARGTSAAEAAQAATAFGFTTSSGWAGSPTTVGKSALFLGDSLTVGLFASSEETTFRHLLADQFFATVSNIGGISGGASHDLLTQQAAITAAAADIVIIELGTNDCVRVGVTEADLAANLRTLIGWCRDGNPSCIIILLSTWRGTGQYPTWDAAIASVAVDYGDHYVPLQDIYDVVANRGPRNLLTLWPGYSADSINYCENPSCEIDSNSDGIADGLIAGHTLATAPTYNRPAAIGHGTYSQRMVGAGGAGDSDEFSQFIYTPPSAFAPGDEVTASLLIKGSLSGCAASLQIYDQSWNLIDSQTMTPTGTTARAEITVTCPGGTTDINVVARVDGIDNGDTFDVSIDDVLIEKTYVSSVWGASPYFDGSMGTGYAWTGTADASKSTRTGLYLTDAYHPNDAGHAAIAALVGSFVNPVVPTVTGFTPALGAVGTTVTLTGTGFVGATAVAFHGTAASFSFVSATQITATVPSGATTGTIAVTTPGGTGTSATGFKLKPRITTLSPTSGHRRVTVVITGTGFGARRGTSYVKFGVAKCSKYLSWSKMRIKCRVPAKAKFGWLKVKVTTTMGASNGKSFRVKR